MFVHKWFDVDEHITRYDSLKTIGYPACFEFRWGDFGYRFKTLDRFSWFADGFIERGYDMSHCKAYAIFSTGELVPFEWHI